uniref:Protein transport protein sec16 n=1 Tax=Takifugu rubripes TaxID=31033 RepID=A0A674MV35_TAKRU
MPAGGPTIPSSTPLQALPNNAQSQAHTGLPLQPLSPPSALPGSASSSLPGMTLFNPQGAASLPVHPDPPTGAEQSYFNSRDQIPPAPSEPPQAASGPIPSQTAFNHEFQERPSQPLPFQPMVPPYPSSQWTPDHGSRPPSVQNYFQPTNDPPPFDLPPQNQMFPANNQVAHHGTLAPSVQPGHPHIQGPIPLQNPANTLSTQWPDPNTPHPHHPHHHNPPFQAQGYFSQSSAPQEPWFNQPPSDSGYHQMGKSTAPPQPDIAAAQHMSNLGPDIASGPSLGPYPHEASALSMFFKDDVENEETLAGERSQVNGGSGSVPHHVHQQPICSQGDDQPPPPLEHSHPQYMNDGNYASQGSTQKPSDTQDRHAENLEYVPNQEVLPSETHCTPAATSVEQFETGPNLETPDSVSRPMRSASVSSNYSNISHGSGTATRRHQGVAGTFIQQESPRLSDEATVSPASGRYFEQIDTSPAGVSCSQQSSLEQMWPSTPSPPKPTGNFQASANSSFEPVRSHGVGVRPPEVDKAKMEAEGGVDSAPGNLEQPPDNMENIYGSGHSLPVASGTVSLSTNPVVHSHSRPSSRAFGASRPCESPATTLWAQNDPASLSTNIVLAPAAPTILAPLREPSTDVIQPPEDGPLDLQLLQRAQQMSQQHLENLENPPKVSEADLNDTQGNLGYASLLVSESLQQPVLIAPPVSTYSVIPSNTSPTTAAQISKRESTPPVRTQGQAASTSQSALVTSSQNPLFVAGPIGVSSVTSKQGPLNLTRNGMEAKSDLTALPQPQTTHPPLSLGGDSHSSLQVNSAASLLTAPLSNHNQRSNYELLDFSMHQSQPQIQAPGPPPSLHESPQSTNGFYLQVTKDAQQGIKVAENLSAHTTSTSSTPQTISRSQAAGGTQPQAEPPTAPEPSALQGENTAPPVAVSGLQPPQVQYPAPAPMPAPGISAPPGPPLGSTVPPGPATGNAAPFWPGPGNAAPLGPHPAITAPPEPAIGAAAPPGPPPGSIVPPRPAATPGPATGSAAPTADVHPAAPRGPVSSGGSQSGPAEPPRPPSSAGSQHGYGPPHPSHGQPYGGYYYGEYLDSRASYPSGQYPPPPVDLRAQQYYQVFQDGQYRSRADGWYGRYEGHPAAYRDQNYQYREPQPERPSSRTSQYSDRPSSRQGYQDDYNRAKRTAYNDYYADYKHYDYAGMRYNYGQYDPRHRGYYDQAYWSYDDAYRARDYYNHQMYPPRKEGYDDQWQYYPGYDSSFDDDYRRRGDIYNDDFDRRSVHSEQSAHSVHSSHSQHSRRSSFSSRSQQSQVYRSQPDLVSAVYDTTSSTLAVDYSYGQYPAQNDVSQNYYGYPEYNAESTWTAPEQPPPRPATPEKFTMPHCCARFGPGGHLVQVLPNLPSAGQPALVDIHSMEVMLQDTPEQSELRSFPGPLVREETHKVDVIKFSQNKALECARDNNLLDRDSARLLWDFIVLLCRQNGTVVGTDIADLLLKEHRSVWLPGKSPNEANLIDFNNEPLARAEEEPGAGPLSLLSDTFMTVPENVGKETERFRELLLFGRKKDALEAAMKAGLWGHALLLASKMDNRTHARVMTRFANSLPINDPLQTVYQLMSGRMPASATCCGEEKWGDWRPHLAMVLSNLTHTLDLDTRTITTMGDTLASKGLLDAAHFCYLMAQVGLGVFTKKSTKMVLIGSNHSLPFFQFATNEAIQRTEAYEYAQSLGSQPCSLPNFQVFKFIYACRLAESGLSAQAFHYCEVVSRTVLMHPGYYSPFFISQIIQVSLRFFDPQLKEKPEQELFNEPEWLMELRQLDGQIRTGVIQYNEERATPTQFGSSSPSSELDEQGPPEPNTIPTDFDGPTPDNPLMSSLLPGPPPQGVQLMPPGMICVFFLALLQGGGGGGWFKNLFWKGKNEAHLPDDKNKSIVWDEQKQKWVDQNEPEEESKPPPPPPSGFPSMPQMPGPAGPGAPSSSGPPVNMFSRKAGTRHKYVDVLNPNKPANSGLAPNPADIFAPLAPMQMPANLFVPSSGLSRSSSMSSLSREVSQHLNQVPLAGP